MVNFIKYLPLAFFSVYISKLLFVGASFADAPIVFIMAVLSAYYEYSTNHKQIKSLEKQLASLSDNHEKTKKDLEDLKNHVAQIKFAAQVKLGGTSVNR